MKKLALIMGIVFCLLSGCVSGIAEPSVSECSLPLGTYLSDPANALSPYLKLKENNEFEFTFSYASSNQPSGKYEIRDNELILYAQDHIFEIKNETLIYQSFMAMSCNVLVPDLIGTVLTHQSDQSAVFPLGKYIEEANDKNLSVKLLENNKFEFTSDASQKNPVTGFYEVKGDELILRAEYYTFRIDGESLIILAEKSSALFSFGMIASVSDGDVFILE